MAREDERRRCPQCRRTMQQVWWKRTRANAQWSDADAVVVFVNPNASDPQTRVRYPGQNTAICPPGYERVEMRSLRDVERFERTHSVRNEMVWYDKGSGRGHDDEFFGKRMTH